MRIARGAALDSFLDKLRIEKFVIGVDRLILVEHILQTHETLTPRQLGSRLRPLLASSPEQQEQFDKHFAEWFLTGPNTKTQVLAGRRWTWPVVALAILGIGMAWWWRDAYSVPAPPAPPQIKGLYEPPIPSLSSSAMAIGLTSTFDASASKSYSGAILSYQWKLVASPVGSRARLANTDRQITSIVPDLPGDYKIELTVHDGISRSSPFTVSFGNMGLGQELIVPILIPDRWTHTAEVNLYDFTGFRWALVPVGVAFLYFFFRYWQRRSIIDRLRQQDRKFQHNIHALTLAPGPRSESAIRAAVRALRRPAQSQPRLNIPKSIDATIRQGGAPALRFESPRRRPEYLILIDTIASRDHQSELFQTMVRSMDKQGLKVYAYLYCGDPRVCRPMPGVTKGGPKTLVDLVACHNGARLLLFGDAGQHFYEQSAEAQPWAKPLFKQWPERTIFTPKPVSQWSDRERALAGSLGFRLLPALQDSLRSLQAESAAFDFYEPAWEYADAESLRADLPRPVYQWLAACALYPRLEWILTMRLGDELKLYSEQGCLQLIRLPWFRQGEMPLVLQQDLVKSMTESDRRRARQAMLNLLLETRKSDPATDDGANANFEIAVQRDDISPADRQELRRDLAVARVAVRSDKYWFIQLPAHLRNLLLVDSRWMSRQNRQLVSIASAMIFVAALSLMESVGSARINSNFQGPPALVSSPPLATPAEFPIEKPRVGQHVSPGKRAERRLLNQSVKRPILHVDYYGGKDGIVADGRDAVVISVIYDDDNGGAAPEDIKVWFRYSAGSIDKRPLVIPRGERLGEARWTSKDAVAAATIEYVAPRWDYRADIPVSNTFKFIRQVVGMKPVVSPSISITDRPEITVHFVDVNGHVVKADRKRSVFFSVVQSGVTVFPATQVVEEGGGPARATIIPTSIGTAKIQIDSENLINGSAAVEINVGIGPPLFLSLLGALAGCGLTYVRDRKALGLKLLGAGAGGTLLTVLYMLGVVPLSGGILPLNSLSIFLISMVGAVIGIPIIDWARGRLFKADAVASES